MKFFKCSVFLLMALPTTVCANPAIHKLAQVPAPLFHDLGNWGAECPQAPFTAVRYLYQSMVSDPKTKTIAVRWDCLVAQHDDQYDCIYNIQRATLTTTYSEAGEEHLTISRLYHVTKAVLKAASREPVLANNRGLQSAAPFAPLLHYGARTRP